MDRLNKQPNIFNPYLQDEEAFKQAQEQLDASYKEADAKLEKKSATQKQQQQRSADDLTHHLHNRNQEMNQQADIFSREFDEKEKALKQRIAQNQQRLENKNTEHQVKMNQAYQELERLKNQNPSTQIKPSSTETTRDDPSRIFGRNFGKGFGADFGRESKSDEDD